MFQHVLPMNIEGTTLFGLSLGTLHSKTIDQVSLGQWVDKLADVFSFMDDTLEDDSEGEHHLTFHDVFISELQAYCLYVASSDGSITDRILEGINGLIGERNLDLDSAISALREANESGWLRRYPSTFKTFVWFAAGEDKDIVPAGEIYYFYRQVARYIYSIEHVGDFDEECSAREYVGAFKKYIERVSAIDFEFPRESESSIADVCREWARLNRAEHGELERGMSGRWKAAPGDSTANSNLSDIVLSSDGRGYMGMWLASWEIAELPGLGMQAPVISIPENEMVIIMTPLDSDNMLGTIYSSDPRLHLKTCVYQRESVSDKRDSYAAFRSPRVGAVGNTSAQGSSRVASRSASTATVPRAAGGSSGTGMGKGALKIVATIVAVLVLVLVGVSLSPAKKYERAMKNYESGHYQAAANDFEALGDYNDSDAMEQKALLGATAQREKEEAGEDPAAWREAAEAFDKMGDELGETNARTCRKNAAYYRGKRLMAKGRWKKAKKKHSRVLMTRALRMWQTSCRSAIPTLPTTMRSPC